MTKKQTKSKKAGSSRKGAKTPAAAQPPKTQRTRERDPRLPAPGTTLTRAYKGKEHRVKVLEDGFECDGSRYRSLTALAREITGYPAISGPAWWGITERAPATPKAAKSKEKPAATKDGAAQPVSAAESATA